MAYEPNVSSANGQSLSRGSWIGSGGFSGVTGQKESEKQKDRDKEANGPRQTVVASVPTELQLKTPVEGNARVLK